MKNRNVIAVVLLSIITLGIYALYWLVVTKRELNAHGANIPTSWLLIIPLVSIFWLYKYYEAAEQVTNKKVNGILMFVLHVLVTGLISYALCQDAYNKLSDAPAVATSEPVNTSDQIPAQPIQETTFTPNVPANSQPVVQAAQPTTTDSTVSSSDPGQSVSPSEEVPPANTATV